MPTPTEHSSVRVVDRRIAVPATDGSGADWTIAATVSVPAAHGGQAPVLVLLPGGGYNRRYFDLPVPGFSQARHHAEQGTVVITIDHLGIADSSVPPREVTDLATVAAADHAATAALLDELRDGTLAPDIEAIAVTAVVGAGQSLGGHVLIGMQAAHRTFDAVATLGSSMAGTKLPVRPGTTAGEVPGGLATEDDVAAELAKIDFVWAFHWHEVRHADVPGPPHDLDSLVAADIAGGMPARHTPPPWGVDTYPGCGAIGMVPGAMAGAAAQVDVPVLIATGERDVCHDDDTERAMFARAPDVALFTGPRMAHMHNFSETRQLLWDRLDEFVAQATPT